MRTVVETCLWKVERFFRKCTLDPGVQKLGHAAAWVGSGFFLTAAAIRGSFQPLALGLICAYSGWQALGTALGAAAGYALHWAEAGLEGVIWAAEGLLLALLPGKARWAKTYPLLIPGLAGAATALTGLGFLFFHRGAGFPLFFLRVCLAPAAAWFFARGADHREPLTDWGTAAVAALALARLGWCGYLAAGILAQWASFPAAVLAGLGLDLAQVTALPMTAILACAWFARLLPLPDRRLGAFLSGAVCLATMALLGIWDLHPLPGLLLGGMIGCCLPVRAENLRRRGRSGAAQVRLELTAAVMAQTQRLLLETPLPEIDQEALLRRAAARACTNCVSRDSCMERRSLNLTHLQDPLSFACRHPWQIQAELICARERFRDLRADRQRRQEYRSALIQQYRFLSVYLQKLSDMLPRRSDAKTPAYRLEVSARSRGKEDACGDRCMAFPGMGCRYYVLLCDGMGTGLGAAHEGQCAGSLLRQMLTAGFPPEYAFRSLNSLLVLRGQAGAVTLDLAELRLDTGGASVYKWGAAPSYVLGKRGIKKIGTVGPPPGISLEDVCQTVDRLSLRREESLILSSDGAQVGEILRRGGMGPMPPGELAQWLLKEHNAVGSDDATVAVIRLHRRQLST